LPRGGDRDLLVATQMAMTNPQPIIDVDNAVKDPTRYFASPADVLNDTALSNGDKRRILQSWSLDAQLINEAESENMGGRPGDRSFLREAKLALLKLDE
jgi:hypothetical protein